MKTLLHICCAPCANQCIEVLRGDGLEITGFWYNPNIHPYTEYRARRDCLREYSQSIDLPVIEKNDYISISQFTLKEVIRQTIFSIAANENNKLMTGELFEVNESELKVVSLDGHRISIRKIQLKDNYGHKKVVVPGKTLNEISRILSGDKDKEVLIFFGNNHILFEFDDTVVVSRLIEGEYFKINQMLSSDYDTKVVLNKKELLDCIERSVLLIRESDKKPIIIKINDEEMELGITSAIGSMKENITVTKKAPLN